MQPWKMVYTDKPDTQIPSQNANEIKWIDTGVFSDSSNLLLWHEFADKIRIGLFQKIQLITISCLQVMHDYV